MVEGLGLMVEGSENHIIILQDALPGPCTSFFFGVLSYISMGYIPKKVGHPGLT